MYDLDIMRKISTSTTKKDLDDLGLDYLDHDLPEVWTCGM